jgi:hypothetical protein
MAARVLATLTSAARADRKLPDPARRVRIIVSVLVLEIAWPDFRISAG